MSVLQVSIYDKCYLSKKHLSNQRNIGGGVYILERCQCYISVSQTNDAFTNLSNFVTYVTFNTVTEGYHWITNAKKTKAVRC